MLLGAVPAIAQDPPDGPQRPLGGDTQAVPVAPVAGDGDALGTAAEVPVFNVMKFTGRLTDAAGNPVRGTVGLTFAFYSSKEDGFPLWLETQIVELDSEGNYTVLLGSASAEGLPVDLFSSDEARWLGV